MVRNDHDHDHDQNRFPDHIWIILRQIVETMIGESDIVHFLHFIEKSVNF